jgi:hypothetical protein
MFDQPIVKWSLVVYSQPIVNDDLVNFENCASLLYTPPVCIHIIVRFIGYVNVIVRYKIVS